MQRPFVEIGLSDLMEEPTTIFSDSMPAIEWAKLGKITPGNNYLTLAYHQVREWVENSRVKPVHNASHRGMGQHFRFGNQTDRKEHDRQATVILCRTGGWTARVHSSVSKKKRRKAVADAAQMIALGINQVTVAVVAKLKQ